ncbi:MAG: SAM-dependent chlorinase/fluorinase [Anaerolineales bacterium]|nr:SAM-dependent chlorinase/fluorinase [Anaerolineales bacterium]
MMPIITLMTDFGTVDGYVGAMKGVLLSLCPQAQLVDITHAIPPQNVYQAAFSLFNAAVLFPPGTVHLVVVDPGVGTDRRPLAIQSNERFYVGPDNGVFSLVSKPADMAVVLENPTFHRVESLTSSTFHGRDIFAPAAAHLASGVSLSQLGSRVTNRVSLSFPKCVFKPPNQWIGQVLYLDAFGNAITNIGILEWKDQTLRLVPFLIDDEPQLVAAPATIKWRGRQFRLGRTYADVRPGQPLALISSNGLLEIAVRDGSAADLLGIKADDKVTLIPKK